jgi:hypothetical protein
MNASDEALRYSKSREGYIIYHVAVTRTKSFGSR